MIIKQELVGRIKDYFGLNIYETKVWLALLSKGVASAREVADISGVPRSRTYDVLESLEKRGYAITKIGKPVKYISVKPTEVLEKMKTLVLSEAQDRVKILATMKETPEYLEIEQLHNSGIAPIKSHDITGLLKGRSNVLARLRELFESAQSEVMICTSITDFDDKSRVLLPALERLLKNDIKVKIALAGDPEKIKKFSAKHNIRVKNHDAKARFFLSDKKEVLFMVTPEHAEEEMGVWLSSPFFTEAMNTIIDTALKNVVTSK